MQNNDIDTLFIKYNEVLKILKEKFNKFSTDNLGDENPISHIKTRIKTKKSIKNKLKDKFNLEYTATNIENNLNDIAGIRIVCPFLSDINKIIDYINNDPDITVLSIKNYIANPKSNGYTGYHMIVSIPVLIDEKIEQVKAEIQIRTMAIDAILSLEHKLRYKSNVEFNKENNEKITSIINFCNLIDNYMDNFIQEKRINMIQAPTSTEKNKPLNLNNFLKKYRIALKKVESIINNIKNDYINNDLINPIEHIKGRIKPTNSIISKLKDKNIDITIENIEKHITDIGAIKIVCSFLSDAQELINILNNETEFLILEQQDYITNPKTCGYSSYHFVVAVPIEVDGVVTFAKIEIQVRTIIMDFWANLEHILCYKKETDYETKEQLKRIANALKLIELEIDELAKTILTNSPTNTKRKIKDKSN